MGSQPAPLTTTLRVLTEAQMTSAAAFVEGGIQDACDDACSICLENFCPDDPATITTCKHEYHLQCILEWSQRSKECPMCWQPLSLKDPDGQALLTTSGHDMFPHHQVSSPFYQRPSLDDTELHRLAASFGNDSDLEERIMQHLAVAAVGRAQHFARRGESLRFRPSPVQVDPHFMVTRSHSAASSTHLSGTRNLSPSTVSPTPPVSTTDLDNLGGTSDQPATGQSGTSDLTTPEHVESPHGTPSELSSDSFKSRLAAASSRYRETLTKTTRGFKERLRVRNGTMAEIGARAREAGAVVGRAFERMSLDSSDKNRGIVIAQNSSAAPVETQVDTALPQSGSRVSDLREGQNCSSS